MRNLSSSRRWLLLGVTALALAGLGVSRATAQRSADVVPPVVVSEAAIPLVADMPSVSGDGRLVAYAGRPPSDDGRVRTVWLLDRASGTRTELTPLVDGATVGESAWPVLSDDGCTVTLLTQIPFDLFRDDDGRGRWDVYQQRLPECGGVLGDLELVSARGSGFDVSAADDVVPDHRPAVSADGSVVAYAHQFGLGSPGVTAVSVVDLAIALGEAGRASRVPGTPLDAPADPFFHRGIAQPSISDDGLVVAFTSDALSSLADPLWGSGPEEGGAATTRVYLWNRTVLDPAAAITDVSTVAGAGTGDAHSPAVSGDGLFVAFVSTAPGLVANSLLPPCTPECLGQVYLYGRADQSLRLVSRAAGAPDAPAFAADAGAGQPALGYSDGEVVFVSRASNLLPTRSDGGGTADDGDIVRVVPATGEVQRVSVLADGVTPAPAVNSHPQVSATGRVVVFDTLAGGVFADPTQVGRQVAALTLTPRVEMADLDVGTVDVAMPGSEWFLVLVNRGPSSFQPAAVTVDNPDFLVGGGTCIDTPVVLAPGASCTVNVRLLPSVAGQLVATLTVSEAGFGATSVSATLSGFGGEAALLTSPGGGHAGELAVGTPSAPVAFDVLNFSLADEQIASVAITGEHPHDFALTDDGCTGKQLTFDQKCTIQVAFTPTAAGRRTAQVTVATARGAYATYLISGDGRHVPLITTSTPTVVAGSRVAVSGHGFSPNTPVVLLFADGSGRAATVVSDATGSISATLLVRANDRSGERLLVGQTAGGEVAGVMITVLPASQPLTPGSPAWPSR